MASFTDNRDELIACIIKNMYQHLAHFLSSGASFTNMD